MSDEKPPAENCKGVNGVDKVVLSEDNRRSAEAVMIPRSCHYYSFGIRSESHESDSGPKTDGSFPPRQAEPRKSHIPCGERTRAHAAAKRSASIERKNHPPKDSREPSYCHVGRSPQALTQYFQRARVKGGGGRKRKIASPLYRPTDRSQFKSLRERTGKEETKRGRSNWIAPDRSALRAPRGFSISVFENCVSELASLDGFSAPSLRCCGRLLDLGLL
ncbi:hypothetical protein OPV22_011416 [Ensete ventricosum]|uniref:DUF4005 domain-containing protein n=1 Tax=Ensete ventricosum TaxID=4639 RepID=A0AAV8RLB0_ENSVE|nr:hypothetical protein OPV22_011416 [Ensete ventricosum]